MTRRRVLQMLSALVVVAAGVVFVSGYTEPSTEIVDQHAYQVAIDEMRDGQGYYAAHDIGIREVYGPVVSPRDVRLPTLYVALSMTPEGSEHVVYVVMAVIAGLITVAFAQAPPSGILVTLYLLTLAVADNGASQYLYAEFWVVPFAIGSIFALDRKHDVAALVLALGAFAVREQAVILLGGVAIYLWAQRRQRSLAAASLGAAGLVYLLHIWAVLPYVDPDNGTHTPLHLGWDPLDSLLQTLGFGFDLPMLGVLFLAGAFWWSHRHGLLSSIGPYLAIPLLTLWVNRPYWGLMVVPVAMVLAVDVVWERVLRRVNQQTRAQVTTH